MDRPASRKQERHLFPQLLNDDNRDEIMKKLPEFKVADSFLSYNPQTGIITRRIDWPKARAKAGDEAGNIMTAGYREVSILGKSYRSHRLAWLLHYGEEPKNQIDHINGVRDDNRIENLRDTTQAENCKNVKKPKNNTSGCVGVYWKKRDSVWRAAISVNDIQVSLGAFKDKSDAIAARLKAEIKYGFHANHGR